MNSDVKPEFSIIIPLYNKAPYIKRAIDSILSQTIQNFEIVVVGGNSSDGGEEIVHEYSDSRIHFVKEQEHGVSSARNQGVREARADFIAFLDADDEWLPNFLETILNLRRKYPDAGLYGTGFYIIKQGSRTECTYNSNEKEQIISNYFRAKNTHGDYLVMTSFMAVPKEIYQSVGGFPENFIQHEDRCLRGKIALEYNVAYSPELCGIYNLNYETYGTRALSYISDPFSLYVSDNYDKIADKNNIEDIIEFSDRGKNGVIVLNLEWNKERKRVRKDILSINSQKLQAKKWILYFISYMPRIGFHYLQVILRFLDNSKEKRIHPNKHE